MAGGKLLKSLKHFQCGFRGFSEVGFPPNASCSLTWNDQVCRTDHNAKPRPPSCGK